MGTENLKKSKKSDQTLSNLKDYVQTWNAKTLGTFKDFRMFPLF